MYFLLLPLLLVSLLYEFLFAGTPPEIAPRDVKEILHHMMESHVSCKQLDPSLVKRAFEHYLELLDPLKTYLLKEEVEPWLSASEQLLNEVVEAAEREDFNHFVALHQVMVRAIQRRRTLETRLEALTLTAPITQIESQEWDWAATEGQLIERLLAIKSLQVTAAAKLGQESKEKILFRLSKKQLSREDELVAADKAEQQKIILSFVLKSFAASFDTHTAYFTPHEATQFLIHVQQKLSGVGVFLKDDLDGFTVEKVIEGGPASGPSGLKENDRILAVNGVAVVGLDIIDVVELIRGEEGTSLCLTVLRSGNMQEIVLKRAEVVIQESRLTSKYFPFGEGVIAHLGLHSFYQDQDHCSATDLYEEICKIQREEKLYGIILDLRSNSGGVLPQAIAVTSLFLRHGIVCSIKDNQGTMEHFRTANLGTAVYDGPLIILTSKVSASASEIVAQTLQDYGRALIVGDPHTYGKGTFQFFTLDPHECKINPKGEFKVTRGSYYTASGKSPQLVGVAADIIVPGIYSELELGERYNKYPLENDTILSHIQDPSRKEIDTGPCYPGPLLVSAKDYRRYLPRLQQNASRRMAEDAFYQKFLSQLQEENPLPNEIELYTKKDPQLTEALEIMKDLIFLLRR